MSLEEPEPVPFHPQPDVPTSFHLVEEGSQRRRTKLVDSLGFSYNVRSKRPYATYWQCTVRPKGNQCKATVIERDDVFTAGQAVHNHSQAVGTYTAVKIISTVKRKAVADVFKPGSAIVDEVMTQYTTVITQFTEFCSGFFRQLRLIAYTTVRITDFISAVHMIHFIYIIHSNYSAS